MTKRTKRVDDQAFLDFLPPSQAAILRGIEPKHARLSKILILLTVFVLLWAGLTEVDETAKGTGKVVPSSRLQVLNNLEGGILKEILVREGDLVEKDQILARLSPTSSQAQYEQDLENYQRYLAMVTRLRAHLNSKPLEFSDEMKVEIPQSVRDDEIKAYALKESKFKVEQKVADEELAVKEKEAAEMETRLESLKQVITVLEEQEKITKPLGEKGITSKTEVLRGKRELIESRMQKNQLEGQLAKVKEEVNAAKVRREQVDVKTHNEDMEKLKEYEVRLAESKTAKTLGADRLHRKDIRSPMKGYVHEIKVRTLGSVVKPGDEILSVVPQEDSLLIETQLSPTDIAFVHPGMRALVKFSAYDYAIYGGLYGQVAYISADSLPDKQDQNFYRAYIVTDKNAISFWGKPLPIKVGMQTEVSIITKRKSILHYIFKPFTRVYENAFSER